MGDCECPHKKILDLVQARSGELMKFCEEHPETPMNELTIEYLEKYGHPLPSSVPRTIDSGWNTARDIHGFIVQKKEMWGLSI